MFQERVDKQGKSGLSRQSLDCWRIIDGKDRAVKVAAITVQVFEGLSTLPVSTIFVEIGVSLQLPVRIDQEFQAARAEPLHSRYFNTVLQKKKSSVQNGCTW